MRILIDMNLPPDWAQFLIRHGHEAVHWSTIGAHDAPDDELLSYARREGYVVFTHDLDFGAILAATKTLAPSVIQVRTQSPIPESVGSSVAAALIQFDQHLQLGALVTVDVFRARAHLLPLRSKE